MGLTRNSVGTDATGLSARALARDWKGGTSAQYVLGESRIEDRGEDDGVGHAALPHGSTVSSTSICASDRSAMIACRQPVLRRMWIARERDGCRALLMISWA